jgi:hypothetical protein
MELNIQSIGIGARIKHPAFGIGIVVGLDLTTIKVFFKGEGDKEISRSFAGIEVIDAAAEAPDNSLKVEDVEKMMKRVLISFSDISRKYELGGKWEGGTMVLKPANLELQSKEVPIETFFHKIVMMRDRLRVLEQNINSHEKLSDEEKVNLQQYITRAYGSMTTFNVLFANKGDFF